MAETPQQQPQPRLDDVKKATAWEHTTEESFTQGSHALTVFILHPDNPSWPAIRLFCGPNGFYELVVGSDGAHFHLGGTAQGLDIARALVAGEKSVIVSYFDNGILESWKLVSASGWPDTFLKHDLALDETGESTLQDLDGVRYLRPQVTRILFNQEPFPDAPDFSGYVPVKCGWMTPERRDAVLAAMKRSGDVGESLLI